MVLNTDTGTPVTSITPMILISPLRKLILQKDTGNCDDIEDSKKESSSFETYTYKFPKVTMDNYKATEIKFKPKVYFITNPIQNN